MALTKVVDIADEVLIVYSREAILQAMPLMVFRGFVDVKTQLGLEPGETIRFLKLNDITPGGQLADEDTPIPKQKMGTSYVDIVVNEYGNSISVSRRALEASFRDVLSDAAVLLGRDYALVTDGMIRDSYLSTANKYYAASSGSGTSTADVVRPFDTEAIKDAVEVLKTLNVPQIVRGGVPSYICIAHPHQLRKLRDDPSWLDANKYVDPSNIYNGEAGRYEDVVFIETTQMPILAGVGSGGADVYRAVIFGAKAVGFAETVPMELVNDGVEDFGRKISIGWYAIQGSGIINEHIIEIQTT